MWRKNKTITSGVIMFSLLIIVATAVCVCVCVDTITVRQKVCMQTAMSE